jgi:hypothetical protein
MTDQELINAAESVLRDAIYEAEFSRLPKDLAYAQVVAEKVENLKAKIAGREAVSLRLEIVGGRMHIEYSMDMPRFLRRPQ